MAQAKEGENGVTKHISMQMSNFPGDLLQRYISRNHFSHKYQQQQQRQEDNEEIELSLGLSLNGRFGVDPTRANYNNNKLIRSSSIPDFLNPISRDNDSVASMIPIGACSTNNLMRTCSLPTETEEEWRKRKELQTLRRMEAKRKRSEKKAARDKNRGFGEENCEEDVKRDEGSSVVVVVNGNYQQEQCVKVGNESLPFGGLNWVNGGGARGGGCGIELRGENSNGFGGGGGGGGGDGVLPPAGVIAGVASQGSIGSQGSGSSGISEFESQLVQGMNKGTEARSPTSVQSLPHSEQKSPVTAGSTVTEKSGNLSGVTMENRSNKPTVTDRPAKEMVRNVLEDMPCVSTKGDGPNGKRIEGFLYRYRKGEEVRIVCVCHGSFLSPAEFVKHAGGGDVAHPLKHIVVSPSSLL